MLIEQKEDRLKSYVDGNLYEDCYYDGGEFGSLIFHAGPGYKVKIDNFRLEGYENKTGQPVLIEDDFENRYGKSRVFLLWVLMAFLFLSLLGALEFLFLSIFYKVQGSRLLMYFIVTYVPLILSYGYYFDIFTISAVKLFIWVSVSVLFLKVSYIIVFNRYFILRINDYIKDKNFSNSGGI